MNTSYPLIYTHIIYIGSIIRVLRRLEELLRQMGSAALAIGILCIYTLVVIRVFNTYDSFVYVYYLVICV